MIDRVAYDNFTLLNHINLMKFKYSTEWSILTFYVDMSPSRLNSRGSNIFCFFYFFSDKRSFSKQPTEIATQTDPDSIIIKIEQKDAIINSLEKRVGPIYVEHDDAKRSPSVSPIPHEVSQSDDLFAKNYTYTTNVSALPLL